MHFYEDPIKAKNVFITFLILSILFFLISGVFGYLYWREYKAVKDRNTQISQKDSEIISLKKQLEGITSASGRTNSNLTEENTALNTQIKSYKAKVAKANAYNEFFKYLNSVISAHSGFTGWSDSEFEEAKKKAEATGDSAFVSTINWAWYETTVNPEVRILRVWNETASGIENALK